MKKYLLLFVFTLCTLSMFSQSIWKPVPSNLFQTGKYTTSLSVIPSVWLWRVSANITAEELVWNKSTKQFNSAPLSSMGPAIGYRHYVAASDGTTITDYGFNAILLLGEDINHVDPASIKLGLTVNCFQYVNIGIDTNFKTVGILLGASINF